MNSKPLKFIIEIEVDDENTSVKTKSNKKRCNGEQLLCIISSTNKVLNHLSEQLCEKFIEDGELTNEEN